MSSNFIRVIAIASGKGGVGKTSISVNLALALASHGKRVVLLDADFGMANVHIQLGFTPKLTSADVVKGDYKLKDVLRFGQNGIRIISASSESNDMTGLGLVQFSELIKSFSDIEDDIDVLVIDTATGIGESVVNMTLASQEVVVVLTDDPASISDSYALIKLLHLKHGAHRFRILVNMVKNYQEGVLAFSKITEIAEKNLDVHLQFSGSIPYDKLVDRTVRQQRGVYEISPNGGFSRAINALARKIDGWPLQSEPSGRIEFFSERLIRMKVNLSSP